MADHSRFPLRYTEAIFVGVAGRMAAGKTSAATYLAHRYGFQYRRYSEVLAEWLSTDPADRNLLQQLGWDIMAGGRQPELNARLVATIDRSKSAAIDGLRHSVDFESLSSTFGPSFEMIFIEAKLEHRFERVQSRFTNLEAFRAADSHPVEAHIDDLRPRASTILLNDGLPENLYERLNAWIAARRSGEPT